MLSVRSFENTSEHAIAVACEYSTVLLNLLLLESAVLLSWRLLEIVLEHCATERETCVSRVITDTTLPRIHVIVVPRCGDCY